MADYKKVIPLTLKYEGGLTNDPADCGGITNYGVCLAFAKSTKDLDLFDVDKDGKITANDIRKLTKDVAVKAFKKYSQEYFIN